MQLLTAGKLVLEERCLHYLVNISLQNLANLDEIE